LADVELRANNQIYMETEVDASAGTSHSLELDSSTISFSDGADILLNAANLTIGDTLAGNVVLLDGATVSLSTGAGAGNITISGTTNGTDAGGGDLGDESLILNAGTGTVALGDVFGAGGAADAAGLTALTITDSGAATFDKLGITGALTQTNAATGLTTFADTVGVGSATLRGTDFVVNSSIDAAGAVAVTNSGTFTLSATDDIVAAGGFSTTGNASLANNITTTNTALTIGGNLTLGNDTDITLSTGVGAGNLSVTGTTNGDATANDESLILNAGTGTVALGDVFGAGGAANAAGLTALTITNSGAATFDKIGITGALTQTNAATDLTTFADTVGVGSATLRGTDFAVNSSIDATGAVAVTNSGTFTLSAADDIAAAGGFSTTGSTSLANNIATTDTALTIGGALTLADNADVTLSTGAGAGSLSITGTTNGTNAGGDESLLLNAGTGTVNLGDVFGAAGAEDATGLTSLTIENCGTATFDKIGITGALTQTNAATGSTTFADTVALGSATLRGSNFAINGGVNATGDVTINSTTDVTVNGTLNANNISITAGNNLNVGANVTGNGTLTLIATGGNISGSGTIQATDGAGTDLTLRQGDSLDLANLTFGNQSNTDLMAESYTGGVNMDETNPANAPDQWKSIAATAVNNIELSSDNDIRIASAGLSSAAGGVKVISDDGTISTPGAGGNLDAPITGFSDTSGTGVDLPNGTGKAAIVIRSPSQDLTLGTDATLTANGTYLPSTDNDDRPAVDFIEGDPIDVAIYLGSYELDPLTGSPNRPHNNVAINSKVSIADYGTMAIDADDTVTFDGAFEASAFDQTNRLEVVSRISQTLDQVINYGRLPHARNPAAISSWFLGTYVLRGDTVLAQVLALTDPVPWGVPRPLELDMGSEVEGPDTEALEKLLNELGIGVQPYVTEAYADTLSTDLRLFSAAEKLQQLIPILEDAEGTGIAALRTTVAQFFPSLDALSEEQVSSFAQELVRHKGDGTEYDAAGQCVFALTEYVTILGNDIGWPADKSIGFVMSRYVPRLTERDEIRLAVIQMQLQKAFGV
jgi:hypothetical protein